MLVPPDHRGRSISWYRRRPPQKADGPPHRGGEAGRV